jgi:hypothetical protein
MRSFTYYFDDLELVPGYAVYASGEADISYVLRPAEPDVGFMEDYLDNIEITAITLNTTKKDGSDLNISQEHPLYAPIHFALEIDDRLLAACAEDSFNV